MGFEVDNQGDIVTYIYGGTGMGTPTRHRLSKRKGARIGLWAYCDSDKCCSTKKIKTEKGWRTTRRVAQMVVKEVPRGTVNCPDCRFVLRWALVKGSEEQAQ